MIKLGDRARDGITGFEGIVVGISSHITGCDTAGLVPEELYKGKTMVAHWFDVTRLKILEVQAFTPSNDRDGKTGGPQPAPHGVSG